MTARTWIAIVVVVVIAGAFLGFTKPGHRILNTLGIATAGGEGATGDGFSGR